MFHTLTFKKMNVILQIEQRNKSCFPGLFGRWTAAFPGSCLLYTSLHDRTGDANHCNRRSFWNYWLHCRLHRQPSGMVRCMCTSDPLLLQDDERQHTDIDLKTILGQKIFILQKYENIADGMTQTILT